MTGEIKNEVALWALMKLKKLAEGEFADTDPIMSPASGGPIIMGRDNSAIRYKSIAQAVEVAGHLELIARAYQLGLPSDADTEAYVTHAAAMIANPEPIDTDRLTTAVNAACNCGGKPPGQFDDCCPACKVYHFMKGAVDAPEEAVEEEKEAK